MPRLTKKLLFVLLTIMAYLPMTVMNVTNAMPTVSSPLQSQSIDTMNMATMAMTGMAAADCHHQTNKTCDHCVAQHTSHCVKSTCSVNLNVAITSPYSLPNISRNLKNSVHTLRINTQFQQPTSLLRPPISI